MRSAASTNRFTIASPGPPTRRSARQQWRPHTAYWSTISHRKRLHWTEEAKSLVTNGIVPKGLVVDLTDVSYVDSVGEKVLTWLASVGASFMAKTVYAASLCERLQLPVHRNAPGSRKQL